MGGGSDLVTCLTTYIQRERRELEEVGKGYMRLARGVTRPDHIQSELAPFDEEEEECTAGVSISLTSFAFPFLFL